MLLTESQCLARGIGDANPERIFTVTVPVTETQLDATARFLRSARQQLANGILAPTCSPSEEETRTRQLAVIARIAGSLETATQVRSAVERAGKTAA